MVLRVSEKKLRLIQLTRILFPSLFVLGWVLMVLYQHIAIGIGVMILGFISGVVSEDTSKKMFCCPMCRTTIPHKKGGRLYVTSLEHLPGFCQKCGWKIQVEQEE